MNVKNVLGVSKYIRVGKFLESISKYIMVGTFLVIHPVYFYDIYFAVFRIISLSETHNLNLYLSHLRINLIKYLY